MKWLWLIVLVLVPASAHAQLVLGSAKAIDGDTIDLGGTRIRLHGIDAPEAGQTCDRDGIAWQCGKEAREVLATLVDGKQIECAQKDRDRHGRIVATCTAGRIDLGDQLVRSGMAVALPQFSQAYVEGEDRAKSLRVGIWGSDFQMPSDYRAEHPDTPPEAVRPVRSRQAELPQVARPAVFYRNCDEARAAGAAPIYRGQAGYRPEMDGDNDGVACEPYLGR